MGFQTFEERIYNLQLEFSLCKIKSTRPECRISMRLCKCKLIPTKNPGKYSPSRSGMIIE